MNSVQLRKKNHLDTIESKIDSVIGLGFPSIFVAIVMIMLHYYVIDCNTFDDNPERYFAMFSVDLIKIPKVALLLVFEVLSIFFVIREFYGF